MNSLDLAFPLLSQHPIPVDHGYALYGALSRVVPEIHAENGIAVHPIRGRRTDTRQLSLTPFSKLVLRVPDGQIAPLLSLAGKSIDIAGTPLRIGVPEVRALVPTTALRSRNVVIKVAHVDPASTVTEEQFQEALRRQLTDLKVSEEVILTTPRRRTLRMKQQVIIGYEVILEGLSAEESIHIQEQGLGGKRHMGCGVFTPVKQEKG